ncbi:MAG: glycosyltransferase, partial [Candidatus Heimdallarchaeota archaeon]
MFIFSIASLFYRTPKFEKAARINSIVIYIPAYKEDYVIINSVKNVLKQKYHLLNRKKFDIVVIAQHLQTKTLLQLNKLDCIVVEYNVEKSTKVKALQYAITKVDQYYDVALILDADNHLEKDFLHKINNAYSVGYQVIQGHRTAKNFNTRFAFLDALSEEMNNSIFRKGFNFFNLSASIIGSGIAFSNKIFIERINASNAIAGFDKEIDNEIVSRQEFIIYLNDAIIFDEKVQNQQVFEKQRTRWIEAQISFAKRFT